MPAQGRLSRNVVTNVVGVGATALLQLAFIPVYIRLVGMEAFGLIGFYLLLVGGLQVFDFGMRATLNREVARHTAQPGHETEARDLVRTLEVLCLGVALLIGVALAAASPYIASHWVKAQALAPATVTRAVLAMSVLAALQWPSSFYTSGLFGLDRQVLVNALRVVTALAAHAGAALVLWQVSPTITAFFAWQIAVALVQLVVTRALFWRSLPRAPRPARVAPALLRRVWCFAAGMTGITVCSMLLIHADRIILSRMLPLEVFGYYTLAWAVANGLFVVINPVFNATLPRLTALVAVGDEAGLRDLYHRGSQLVAVMCLPLAAVVAVFAPEVLLVWTKNAETARHAAPIVSVLVAGTALNGVLYMPYALQLAFGWTTLSLATSVLFSITLIPAVVVMTTHYGPVGAAAVWGALNLISFFVIAPLVHRRLLRGAARRWFADVSGPLLAAGAAALACRAVLPRAGSRAGGLVVLVVSLGLAAAAAVLAAPRVRAAVIARLVAGRRS